MYHYIESGLDNIYLENGYQAHDTPYGKGVSIQDTDALHREIGRTLIEMACPLNGAELRFLRLEMEQTQRRLATLLKIEEQAVRRWEKARTKPFNGSADQLLRILYRQYAFGDGEVRKMMERLAELDCVERPTKIRLRENHHHWEAEPA